MRASLRKRQGRRIGAVLDDSALGIENAGVDGQGSDSGQDEHPSDEGNNHRNRSSLLATPVS